MTLVRKKYVQGDYEKYIRELTKKHMQDYFMEHFGGWSDQVSEKKFFELVRVGSVHLFFEQDEFVGYVTYVPEKNDEQSILITDIHIRKVYTRKGHGSKILDFVITTAHNEGKKQVKVFVFKNNPALLFYTKNGFTNSLTQIKSHTRVLIKKV